MLNFIIALAVLFTFYHILQAVLSEILYRRMREKSARGPRTPKFKESDLVKIQLPHYLSIDFIDKFDKKLGIVKKIIYDYNNPYPEGGFYVLYDVVVVESGESTLFVESSLRKVCEEG